MAGPDDATRSASSAGAAAGTTQRAADPAARGSPRADQLAARTSDLAPDPPAGRVPTGRSESRARRGGDGVSARAERVIDETRELLDAVKPRLRGWLHAGMFPLALAAGIVLVAVAGGPQARVACAIYAGTAALLFGVSALYHRFEWGPRASAVLRRLDHANIFLIIAGTYTPTAYLLLDGSAQRTLLTVIWTGALAGVAFRVLWVGAPRWLYTPVYIALGWAALFFLPDFLRTGGVAVTVLIVVGGLLYTAGGIVYALQRPNPSPRWFGFHEVFHALTIAAFVTHYVAVTIAAVST